MAAKEYNTKPLHRLTWSEKEANDKEYYKRSADYYLGQSTFTGIGSRKAHMETMYQVYNNQIPTEWFNHVTDPLSAKEAKHSKFPAKIRPTNILRTNIDLLLGEFPRRSFPYRVENLGEGGYNRYMEVINSKTKQAITDMFLAFAQQEAEVMGAQPGEISDITPDQVPMPAEVKERAMVGYKDREAIKGQKWLTRALTEYGIKKKIHKMFKDLLIAGECISLKNIYHGELQYDRLSPLYSDYDKSDSEDFIEDGEWFTHVQHKTIADVVDMAYDELDEKAHRYLESYTGGASATPQIMYNYLTQTLSGTSKGGKIPVYMCFWKGRKQIGYVIGADPVTGEPTEQQIDETEFDTLPKGVVLRKEWVNEVYETWRIGDAGTGLYFRIRAVPAQRNAMNNFSVCKLPANGRKYSDTHADNISVMQIGIPYLIMYMITGRTLELTIAKSKGKILVMDNNAIPRTKGWNEEKFFYYSEALGYALIDRNQIGVDKSFNQYQVLDMSLFDQIEKLIIMQSHFKQEWDDIIGISRQRKAQTMASETNASNERAIFQSTVITEMIYSGFDEFVEKELQGFIDLSKFTNAEGIRKLYNGSEEDEAVLEIDPVPYCSAELGVFIQRAGEDHGALEMMKQFIPEFVQNGVKPSGILEMLQAGNIASLKAKLKAMEAMQAEMEQSMQGAEFEAQAAADERKKDFMQFEKVLESQLLHEEYDRKEDLAYIEGEVALSSFGGDGDNNDNGIPDINELIKNQTQREKMDRDDRQKMADRLFKDRIEKGKLDLEERRLKQEERKAKSEERMEQERFDHEQKMMDKELQKADKDVQKANAMAKKAAQKPKPAAKK